MRCLIVTGGRKPPDFLLKSESEKVDLIIAADHGYDYLRQAEIPVDIAVGDFDSISHSQIEAKEVITHPAEKDETDTELALRIAQEKGCSDLVLLGGWGSRWDHSLANIFLMEQVYRDGGNLTIKDENNTLILAPVGEYVLKKEIGYVSILPMTQWVTYSTEGFYYQAQHLQLQRGTPRGVSNEFSSAMGKIIIHDGVAFLFMSKDEKSYEHVKNNKKSR